MRICKLIMILALIYSCNKCNAQVQGCTDPMALNFNSSAVVNDGSCIYDTSRVSPLYSFILSTTLSETSGLIHWNGYVWTNNDSDDNQLYALDTLNGNIVKSVALTGLSNNDWEEISEDEDFIYVGDFGNNSDGNRKDLRIWRISKSSILENAPVADAIDFSYSDQVTFTPAGSNNTDFDCEAMVVSSDSIYLFTKQWISKKSSLYSLPKTPGVHTAGLKAVLNVNGLITGATYLESKRIIALTGYGSATDPFIIMLYDFKGYDFFSGNKRKFNVALPFHQVEAITTADGLRYYITNEYFSYPPVIEISQKMHILDLSQYLGNYLGQVSRSTVPVMNADYSVFPVPAGNSLTVKSDERLLPARFRFTNLSGQVVLNGRITRESLTIDISSLPSGLYIFTVGGTILKSFKIIRK
ncbi:MAG: T9SS type A sorting domain-containing protein [Bacteroidales bacterium]|nr:T9SS type A sorting domain-containing protein [Bacteroidales bacterium]